jgi:adenylate cyclase
MLRTGPASRQWSFDESGRERFDVFDEVKREGGQAYLACLILFEKVCAPDLRGIAASFSTDRERGFFPDEIARVDAVLPLVGLAAYRMTLFDLTVSVLDPYVGLSEGCRVLSGDIRRGSGTTLPAALLFVD